VLQTPPTLNTLNILSNHWVSEVLVTRLTQ
jgi:hypothetical protein